jgi:hypothetical protein
MQKFNLDMTYAGNACRSHHEGAGHLAALGKKVIPLKAA